MAENRGIYQSWFILSGWTSSGCCAWFCSSFKRKRPLDWNISWVLRAISSSFYRYCLYRLEQTGNKGKGKGI
ncbi:hypothetical protein POPTR_004G094850v4 [Populus trichocarpa]|uniref:Uncharacterized protein n=1 Tax=Populus trichocarpa TaxID=3694 RepID=A0ACC0T421_POPTR|nr:hypothetical protein POPTR_004G094850v4 [Populus trichocarpa]